MSEVVFKTKFANLRNSSTINIIEIKDVYQMLDVYPMVEFERYFVFDLEVIKESDSVFSITYKKPIKTAFKKLKMPKPVEEFIVDLHPDCMRFIEDMVVESEVLDNVKYFEDFSGTGISKCKVYVKEPSVFQKMFNKRSGQIVEMIGSRWFSNYNWETGNERPLSDNNFIDYDFPTNNLEKDYSVEHHTFINSPINIFKLNEKV